MDAETSESPETLSPEKLSSTLSKDSRLVRELQSKLSAIGSNKDSAVRTLREIGYKLRSISAKVTELKAGRDKETAAVRELKSKRQEANDSLKAAGAELKKAAEAKEAARAGLPKRRFVPRSTSHLASEIESLEMKIQTDVMAFEKEKELMKVIKDKKKLLDSSKLLSEAAAAHREAYAKFSELRKQSNALHKEMQQHAAESQKMHEEMMKLVPQLRELRGARKEILDRFGKIKEDYTVTGSTLQEKLHELSEVKEKLDTISAEKRKKSVEQKEQQLTEMLKSGKKLTAKDLITLRDDK